MKDVLDREGVGDMRLGVDMIETRCSSSCRPPG
jgi:hypothetical protein